MEERKVNPAKGRPDNVLEVVIPVHPDAISNSLASGPRNRDYLWPRPKNF